ncbi:MAG: TraR/DksA family transcriptional regulator [Myxococcales bacterium]
MPTEMQAAELRQRLLQRRRRLVEAHQNTNRDIGELMDAPKDPELEETAQAALAEYTLHRLTDGQRREVEAIDAALARMEAGEYGSCEECGAEISFERLQALPFAARCTDCATMEERRGRGIVAAPGTI